LEPEREQQNVIAITSDCVQLLADFNCLLDNSEPVSKLDGEGEINRTFLISVHPRWAASFFLTHNPKTIELRKGSFGVSLKPGDRIAIYATLPTAEVLGIVQVVRRELLAVDRLWRESEQGKLAKISRVQFDAYYANQESGIGVWVAAPELLPSPIALPKLRQNWGPRWQPPQQLQRLTDEQIAALNIAR
jgi:predicted transcriptional regulator